MCSSTRGKNSKARGLAVGVPIIGARLGGIRNLYDTVTMAFFSRQGMPMIWPPRCKECSTSQPLERFRAAVNPFVDVECELDQLVGLYNELAHRPRLMV